LFDLKRRVHVVVMATVLWACRSSQSGPVTIAARLDPADSLFGGVEVRGLSPGSIRTAGPELLRVEASEPLDTTSDLPPLVGRYVTDDGILRFVPRYRPAGGLKLRVTLVRESVIVRDFLLPADAVPPATTTVTAVYPSADTIPANHLRWYLEFSAPMREGEATGHIQLVDAGGEEVADAFLIVSEELWDPGRRRLTVLFDPGRVKRGVRQNLESGAPLVAGGNYVLRIDPAWRDGRGAPLAQGFEKRFHVVEAERSRLDPAGWSLEVPWVGTREPVTLDFGRALDKALGERLITVMAGEGRVAGTVHLGPGERTWRLLPERPWSGREYEIRVSPLLEDPAGNTVTASFDRDRTAGEWRNGEEPQPVSLRFRPVPEEESRVGFRGTPER
jgi:hypothetical protein